VLHSEEPAAGRVRSAPGERPTGRRSSGAPPISAPPPASSSSTETEEATPRRHVRKLVICFFSICISCHLGSSPRQWCGGPSRRVRESEETNYEAKRGTTTLGCGSCGDLEAFLSNGDDAPAPEPYLPPERPSARDPSSVCGQRPCSGIV